MGPRGLSSGRPHPHCGSLAMTLGGTRDGESHRRRSGKGGGGLGRGGAADAVQARKGVGCLDGVMRKNHNDS
jgi:hypothetical protein